MIVTVWSNGKPSASGAGYGLKVSVADRDQYFRRDWQEVEIILPGRDDTITVNVAKASFWGPACRELIQKEIGRWLMDNGLAPWPKGKPPQLELEPSGGRFFFLRRRKE